MREKKNCGWELNEIKVDEQLAFELTTEARLVVREILSHFIVDSARNFSRVRCFGGQAVFE
jgi:hypothetical protein